MARTKKRGLWVPTLIAVLITVVLLIIWPEKLMDFFKPVYLWAKVIKPMCRSLTFITLGLMAAMVIEALGWTVWLGRLASPLTNLARLPQTAAASFTTALISNPAANGLLSEALESKAISPKMLVVANLLNGSWPTFIIHLPTTLVVAFSFAGQAGLAYTGIMFGAATLRLFGAAIFGRFLLPPLKAKSTLEPPPPRKKLAEILPALKTRLLKRFKILTSVAAPVFYLITLVSFLGFFDFLRDFTAIHMPDFFLPVEAAALIIFSLTAEFSSGFIAAGALLHNSTLTMAQAAAALVLGNIISTPIRVLRWQLAAFLGFFQVRLGLFLIFCNQAFRVASLALSLFIFWEFFGA